MSQDYNKTINPSHYTKGMDVQEFCYSHNRNGLASNIIKYVVRYDVKNTDPLEDLYKAKQCIEKLISLIIKDNKSKKITIKEVQKIIDDQDRENMDKFFKNK